MPGARQHDRVGSRNLRLDLVVPGDRHQRVVRSRDQQRRDADPGQRRPLVDPRLLDGELVVELALPHLVGHRQHDPLELRTAARGHQDRQQLLLQRPRRRPVGEGPSLRRPGVLLVGARRAGVRGEQRQPAHPVRRPAGQRQRHDRAEAVAREGEARGQLLEQPVDAVVERTTPDPWLTEVRQPRLQLR